MPGKGRPALDRDGELGYEINCLASEHATLRNILLEAGRALRVEIRLQRGRLAAHGKELRHLVARIHQDYTPG